MPARPYYEHEPMSGSPTIIRRVDVVTTTLFTGPTVLAPPINSSSPVPIPAIAGGACAGAVIAVLVVVGWKWWGRSIKRKQRTERQKRVRRLSLRQSSLETDKRRYRLIFRLPWRITEPSRGSLPSVDPLRPASVLTTTEKSPLPMPPVHLPIFPKKRQTAPRIRQCQCHVPASLLPPNP